MLRAAGRAVDDASPASGRSSRARCGPRTGDIEPDLSGAAPFLAAAIVTGGKVTVPGWPAATTQPGDRSRELLERMGGRSTLGDGGLTVRGPDAAARHRRRPVRGRAS